MKAIETFFKWEQLKQTKKSVTNILYLDINERMHGCFALAMNKTNKYRPVNTCAATD